MKFVKRISLPILLVILLAAYIPVLLYMRYEFGTVTGLDEERLGQLGDFFGGILNPIFGFLTVLLLVYGSSIQKQETLNSNAMLELAKSEARRKQVEDALSALYLEQDQLFRKQLHTPFNDGAGPNSNSLDEAYSKDLTRKNSMLANNIRIMIENDQLQRDLPSIVNKLGLNLHLAKKLTCEIVSLIDETSQSARDYWIHRFMLTNAKCKRCGVSDFESYSSINYHAWKHMFESGNLTNGPMD